MGNRHYHAGNIAAVGVMINSMPAEVPYLGWFLCSRLVCHCVAEGIMVCVVLMQ